MTINLQVSFAGGKDGKQVPIEMQKLKGKCHPTRQRHWESDTETSDTSDSPVSSDAEPEADYQDTPGPVNQSQFTFGHVTPASNAGLPADRTAFQEAGSSNESSANTV